MTFRDIVGSKIVGYFVGSLFTVAGALLIGPVLVWRRVRGAV